MFHIYKILPRMSPHQGSSRFTNAVSHHSLVTMLADSLNLALRNQGTSPRPGSQWDALPASSCPEVCAITGMRCGAALLGIMGERQESRASYSHGCATALFPQQKCCAATLHIRVAGDSAGRAAIALATSSSAPRAPNSSTTASSPRARLLMNTTQFRMTPPSPGCCLKAVSTLPAASSMRHIASHDVGAHITLTHSEQKPKQALTRALQAAAAITLLVPATPNTNTIQPSAASSDLHRRL
jgi:hypothetical protein